MKMADLSFAHLSPRVNDSGGRTYYDMYFIVSEYDGIPKIMEPDKCSELKWFKINDIPNDIMDIRKIVLDNYRDNIQYSEIIKSN